MHHVEKKNKRRENKVKVREDRKALSPLPNLDEWLEIGKIVSPQGLRGEVRVYPNSDFPERFQVPGKRWILYPGGTAPQPIELLSGRYLEGKNLYVLTFEGVGDRNQAEAIRDCLLMVPIGDRPELDEGEYHVLDLMGLEVFMEKSGELVGTVVDIIAAGNNLLEVKFDPGFAAERAGKTVLIPFVREIVPIVDLSSRRLEINPPPGLLEITSQ